MRVFLTGGTGFIGQPLAQALCARNWQTTVLVRHPESQAAQVVIVSPNGVIGRNDHAIWGYFSRLYVNDWMPPLPERRGQGVVARLRPLPAPATVRSP